MAAERRRSAGSDFGEGGGTNVADYLGLIDRADEAERGERIVDVRIDRIASSPYQVRIDLDAGGLEALGEDVKANGLHHPVTLRAKPDGRYELLAGERRWLAMRAIGRESIQARIRDVDEFNAHLIGVGENNQRANLSPWERALEALDLQRHAIAAGRPHTQRDLARYLGRNVSTVNQQLTIAGAITVGLIAGVNVDARDVCKLSHEALHRTARLASSDRADALADAARKRATNTAAGAARTDGNNTEGVEPADRWTPL